MNSAKQPHEPDKNPTRASPTTQTSTLTTFSSFSLCTGRLLAKLCLNHFCLAPPRHERCKRFFHRILFLFCLFSFLLDCSELILLCIDALLFGCDDLLVLLEQLS